VRRHAWGDGAHKPCAARHAAFKDHIFASICFKKENVLEGEDIAQQYHAGSQTRKFSRPLEGVA
jgi:hypothetical protein